MKVEVHVLGSPSLIVRTASVDVKQHLKKTHVRAQELCVKVEVAVLGSPTLISIMVSVEVEQHLKKTKVI